MTQTNDRPWPGWFRFGPDLNMRVSDADRAMVADRLAQPDGSWKPFDRSGWRALIYPDPAR